MSSTWNHPEKRPLFSKIGLPKAIRLGADIRQGLSGLFGIAVDRFVGRRDVFGTQVGRETGREEIGESGDAGEPGADTDAGADSGQRGAEAGNLFAQGIQLRPHGLEDNGGAILCLYGYFSAYRRHVPTIPSTYRLQAP